MAEPTAREVIAATLIAEGGAPGNSLHSWRCEYPDRYGPCDCVPETAGVVLDDLAAAGYSVVRLPDRKDITAWICVTTNCSPILAKYAADAVLALFTEATDG